MNKDNTIKVSKIEIKIGKQVISLTTDELKELKDVLDRTFGYRDVIFVPGQPIYIPQPVIIPQNPYPYQDPWRPMWTITCQNNSETVCLSLNNTN